MEIYYCKKLHDMCNVSIPLESTLWWVIIIYIYIANPGTKHKTRKRSTTSNGYKIYSITADSSYIQVPNPQIQTAGNENILKHLN